MQRVAEDLYQALKARTDIEVVPLVLHTSWKDTNRKIAPFLFRAYREIRATTHDKSVDVVLFSSMVTATLSVLLRRSLAKAGIGTAAIVHGLDVTTDVWVYQRIVRRVFGALNQVLPISRATAEACIHRGLAEEKVSIVPNGIDIARFDLDSASVNQGADGDQLTESTAQKEESLRKRTAPPYSGQDAGVSTMMRRKKLVELAGAKGIDASILMDEDVLLLTSVGRQVKRKGFDWFVNSVMPLLPDNVHYWLAGDGPETATIQASIERTNLGGRVTLLGRVSDELLNALYQGGDLFVMPNIHVPGDMEGFGVVLLEAGLNGQPAIAAAIEGILDVVTNGKNGILVESANTADFVAAIQQFNKSRAELRSLSRRCRTHTIETFSWPSVADQYVATLRNLSNVSR